MPIHPDEPRLFLRAEPTCDSVLLEWAPDAAAQRKDVVAYEDTALTRIKTRWPWYYTFSKPRRFRKSVRIAGQKFAIVWQPDLKA